MALVQWARGGRARQVWIHYCGIGANQAAVLGGEAAADESGVAMVPIDVAERGVITNEVFGAVLTLALTPALTLTLALTLSLTLTRCLARCFARCPRTARASSCSTAATQGAWSTCLLCATATRAPGRPSPLRRPPCASTCSQAAATTRATRRHVP